MKHFLLLCAMVACSLTAVAQTVTDSFVIGPYLVDYLGDGETRYRLRDNINLYEFFDLRKDTTVISMAQEIPVEHAIQLSLRFGANRSASKDLALEGVWKQNIAKNLYFNGGLSLAIDHTDFGKTGMRRNMFEVGIPLQIELGNLNRQYASLYGLFGIAPTFYSTMNASSWNGDKRVDDIKKSGFLIAPSLEFGGNIPVGGTVLRLGIHGIYKINCTTGDYDVYGCCAGRAFLGAKIGVVL